MSNHSKVAEGINDAYFTSEEDAQFVAEKLRLHNWLYDGVNVLEPACGNKALVKPLEEANIKLSDLVDYGVGAEVGNYLESNLGRYDLVLTNPPFGRKATLAVAFFNKAATNSDRIAFIVPQSFRKVSIMDRLDSDYWPVGDYDLPNQTYDLPDGSKRLVRTCFQLWERRGETRPKLRTETPKDAFFIAVKTPEEADFALRTQGSAAGNILPTLHNADGSVFSGGTTAYLKGGRDRIEAHDWSQIAGFAASIPAIGLTDIRLGLQHEDRGGDMEEFLRKGAITLLM